MKRTFDVICLGRAAVDLYGQQLGGRLEDMQSFEKYLGGSSGNLAAGLARLGSKSSMLTRVGDEHMGRFVCEALAREGVDTSHVITDPQRMTGLVLLGISDRNSFPHIFFRENCADMGLETNDFTAAYIASSRALAITGTHLSTEQSMSVVRKAIKCARTAGTRVILDIDYRPVLWGLTAAGDGEERFIAFSTVTEKLQSLLSDIDILVGTEEEIRITGGGVDVMTSLRQIRSLTKATIVLKRGAIGCTVFEGEIPADLDDGISVDGVRVEVLNVLGAGDAFLSGFLHSWLKGESWKNCARAGNACGALVVSRHGCTPAMPTGVELNDYLERANSIDRPDKDAHIQYLHRASTRLQTPENLLVLAFDHRSQFEDLVVSTQPAAGKIAAFKSLLCDAALQVAETHPDNTHLGIIVDGHYGESVLARMSARKWWIARPVEMPGSCPVEFDPHNNMGLPLLSWPASHVVKCLLFYHPGDSIELRLIQEERIRQLHADCIALDRELLLEVISTASGKPCNESTTANVLRRFYNLGVFPAWWKLQHQSSEGWREISSVIGQYDPLCHGVIMLGLDAPVHELKAAFRLAAQFPVCKGFAIGRSIFGSAARQWFDNRLTDQAVIDEITDNYQRMIHFWHDAHADAEVAQELPALATGQLKQ